MKKSIFGIVGLVVLFNPSFTHADRRNFAWTYEAKTMPPGGHELEHYFTVKTTKRSGSYATKWEPWIEYEYGITDRLDLGLYQMFKQKDGESLSYNGYKVRARYRLTDQGEWFIDPLLYVEWIHKPDEIEFEQKIILAKVIGKFVSSLNFTFEQERENSGEWEYIFAPSLGLGYKIAPWFTFGAEALAHTEVVEGKVEHTAFFAGPTVSFVQAKSFITLSFLYQATDILDEHDRIMTRMLLGIFL